MRNVLSLYELNASIRDCLGEFYPAAYWIQAEVSSCSCRNAAGHCYLELVEKEAGSDRLKAKARANIWRSVWEPLRARFERETGTALAAGQKILIQASVDFHELYGLSLTVVDIDPSYTLGDWALRRKEILRQLQADGVAGLNKELPWPALPQRVAVISSPGAAGYGDFCHQLAQSRFAFYVRLFPAVVQGNQAEASVLCALEAIAADADMFDVVVIIRGGGAVTDLTCFDGYDLSSAVAQFPLPVLAGIGHERDRSVVDEVAHLSVKTPTAAAAHLIDCMQACLQPLDEAAEWLKNYVAMRCEREVNRLQQNAGRLQTAMTQLCHREDLKWQQKLSGLRRLTEQALWEYGRRLTDAENALHRWPQDLLQRERYRLGLREKDLQMYSPEAQLKRGYSITTYGGKPVKDIAEVPSGARLETRLANGVLTSVVE